MTKPTRRDREMALEVVYGKNWRGGPWVATVEERERFLETGDDWTLPGLPGTIAYGIANGREDGRRVLEQRIRELVAASKALGLSRGTCETLCDELLEETDEEWLAEDRGARERAIAKAREEGYAACQRDVIAWLRSPLTARRLCGAYDGADDCAAIARAIGSGEYVGAAAKERGDG